MNAKNIFFAIVFLIKVTLTVTINNEDENKGKL